MMDLDTGKRVKKISAHREIINALDRSMSGGSGTERIATASDDGTVKIWEGGEDARKEAQTTLKVGCPVTSVCWSADGNTIYAGAIDNEVHVRCTYFSFRKGYSSSYSLTTDI